MDWVLIKVGTALIGAGNTILDKKLATRPDTPPLLHAASFGLVSIPVVLVGLCLLPPIAWGTGLCAILAGILFMVAVWLYYGVMAKQEVSEVTLLMRLTGIETMILSALFLGERLTMMQHAAFAIGTVGGVLLALTPGKAGIRLNRAAGTILLITILLAIESILLTPIYRTHSVYTGMVYSSVGQIIGTVILIGATADKQQLWRAARSGGGLLWGTLIGEQTVRLFTSVLSGQIIAQGVPLALAAAMSGLRPMCTLILAAWLLGERWPKETLIPRLFGMICLMASMVLVVWR